MYLFIFPQNYRAYSFCGTIEYMAPEVVEGGHSGHDFVSILLQNYRAYSFCGTIEYMEGGHSGHDFVSIFLQNYQAYSFCGTIEYMAPEVVEKDTQDMTL